MNLILFFVFLLCDLMIVPICWFSYGDRREYREGMLLGVHIPQSMSVIRRWRNLCKRIWKEMEEISDC